jgi:hypothetical protein
MFKLISLRVVKRRWPTVGENPTGELVPSQPISGASRDCAWITDYSEVMHLSV